MITSSRLKQFLFSLFILLFGCIPISAKQWRGIVPLKSTRVDVERLLGKPNEYGRYQFPDEKVLITYSTGHCSGKANCECLAPADTVVSIYILPERTISYSKLPIDKSQYQRLKSRPDLPSATYTNEKEGIRYMVNERLDSVESIEILPTARDCQPRPEPQTPLTASNQWRGIRPLYSTKSDVDSLLGPPKNIVGRTFIYEMGNERVDITYSAGDCKLPNERWNVPPDSVISIEVTPKAITLVKDLQLDKAKYQRRQSTHPEDISDYENLEDGIVVHTILNNGCEEVISIVYVAAGKDADKRCPR
jgi:hypothetical protein